MDVLLEDLFRHFLEETGAARLTGQQYPMTIMASGGYGRAQLNPGSDIDLQFLVPGSPNGWPRRSNNSCRGSRRCSSTSA